MKNKLQTKVYMNIPALGLMVALAFGLFVPNAVVAYSSYTPSSSGSSYSSYTPSSSGSSYSSYTPSSSYSSYTPSSSYSSYTPSNYSSYSSYTPNYSDYSSYSSYTPNYSDYSSYSSYTPNYSDYSSYSSYTPNYSDYSSYSSYTPNYSDYSSYSSYTPNYSDYSSYSSYTPNYASNGYTDYYTPGTCSGSSCGGSGYTDYYTPGTCSGSSCGGQSRGNLGLGLNLNYSDNDTTVNTRVKNNIDNSVRITEDNSVRITEDNDTTTTTTNSCSNGDGNCNTTTTTHIATTGGGNNNDDLEIQCRVSDTSIDEGDTVTYSVEIDGGRSPYDIEWDGDISGDSETERVRYNRDGRYEVEVTVRDRNGDRASDTCATVRVGNNDDDNNINVITRTNLGTPSGNLASLDSVFLSQVPYTGPEDVLKALGVLAFIAIWSTGVAMYFKRRRQVRAVASRLQNFKEANKSAATIR